MIKPPTHLTKIGREAFVKYVDRIPDFPDLAEALAEVEQLLRQVRPRMTAKENPATAQEQRLYLSLIDKRLTLLTAAGLTPKAKRYLMGSVMTPAADVDTQDKDDDAFLDS